MITEISSFFQSVITSRKKLKAQCLIYGSFTPCQHCPPWPLPHGLSTAVDWQEEAVSRSHMSTFRLSATSQTQPPVRWPCLYWPCQVQKPPCCPAQNHHPLQETSLLVLVSNFLCILQCLGFLSCPRCLLQKVPFSSLDKGSSSCAISLVWTSLPLLRPPWSHLIFLFHWFFAASFLFTSCFLPPISWPKWCFIF